jgi:hypothetical protein
MRGTGSRPTGEGRWLKIRNQGYSQWVGREELFERERGSDPDFHVWYQCALARAWVSPSDLILIEER